MLGTKRLHNASFPSGRTRELCLDFFTRHRRLQSACADCRGGAHRVHCRPWRCANPVDACGAVSVQSGHNAIALFARQGRVPWPQHAAEGIGRQSAANGFAHPQAVHRRCPCIRFKHTTMIDRELTCPAINPAKPGQSMKILHGYV